MATPTNSPERPLRRDAQRNVERIRAAATEVFREQGLMASHEVIARRADLAVGTVYRRFPDREQLIDSLFEHELDAVVAVAEEAAGMEDPWAAVVHLFTRTVELSAENLGLKQLITGSQHGAERVQRARARLGPRTQKVIERARAAGAIRPDAAPQDVPLTVLMLSPLIDAGRAHAPDLWRRYLALLLDGLRPDGQRREPLPPASTVEIIDEVVGFGASDSAR